MDAAGQVTIIETTVQDLSGWSVAASNIYDRDLPDAAGVARSRTSALLTMWQTRDAPPTRQVVVEGSTFTVGGRVWRVVRVEAECERPAARSATGPLGAVVVEPVEVTGRPGEAAT